MLHRLITMNSQRWLGLLLTWGIEIPYCFRGKIFCGYLPNKYDSTSSKHSHAPRGSQQGLMVSTEDLGWEGQYSEPPRPPKKEFCKTNIPKLMCSLSYFWLIHNLLLYKNTQIVQAEQLSWKRVSLVL